MHRGVVVVLALASAGVVPGQGVPGDSPCSRFAAVGLTGSVTDVELTEISGLAASRRYPGVIWTHNDSGGRPEVSALDEDGLDLGSYPVEGAEAIDWEDIGAGGDGSLYIGDIGDNAAAREQVTLYRVAEPATRPDGSGGTLTDVDTIQLRYPRRPQNAEALFVDPITGDLFILTKSDVGRSGIFRAPSGSLVDGETLTMTDEGPLTTTLATEGGDGSSPGAATAPVTAADISPDGAVVLVRTYSGVLAYQREAGENLATALQRPPCVAPAPNEPQGEAIAFSADGDDYFTASEGTEVPLYRVGVDPPAVPTSLPDSPTGSPPPVTGESAPTAGAWAPAVAAAVVLAVLAGLAALVQRRRRRANPARR